MASKFPIDLKRFKYVKSDKDSTTLQHKDGHELTISHKPLSKDMRSQLEALSKISKETQTSTQAQEAQDQNPVKMADGGKTEPIPKGNKDTSYMKGMTHPEEDAPKPTPTPKNPNVYKSSATGDEYDTSSYANGGKVQKYAEGTDEVQPPDITGGGASMTAQDLPEIAAKQALQAPDPVLEKAKDIYNQNVAQSTRLGPDGIPIDDPATNMFGVGREIPKDIDPAIWAKSKEMAANQITQEQSAQEASQQAATEKAAQQSAIKQELGVGPQTTQIAPSAAPEEPAAQTVQPQAAPAAQSAGSNDLANPMGLMERGFNLGMQGAESQAKATAQLGQDEQAAYNRNQEALKAANDDFQSNVKDNQAEYDNFIKDYQNQHIDPEQYWKGDPKTGEGGHSKIVTGISMLLSGFGGSKGAGMFNDYLKYQMDNNIKAQEAELGKRKNLLEANLRHFGNIRDATEMTRAMQAGMVAADLGKAMAQARGPLALANMKLAQSQLIQNFAPRLMAISANQSLYKLANSQHEGPASDAVIGHALNNLDIYNPEAAKTWREKYVPGVGFSSSGPVSEATRNQIASHKSVNDLMNMSMQFSKQHAGTLNPSLRAQAATIQQQLVGAVKQAQHDGVYKPSEAEFVLSQVGGSPASFLANISSVPKLKQMQAIKQNDYNELLRAHGLPTQQLNAPEVKTINGVQYTKVPGGWKKAQ